MSLYSKLIILQQLTMILIELSTTILIELELAAQREQKVMCKAYQVQYQCL